jgi:hypothetical protein
MTDASATAALRNMIAQIGEAVTFQRITGVAPNATVLSINIMARVRGYSPESAEVSQTGYAAAQAGSITQTDRKVIVVAADFIAAGGAWPILKNDKIILQNGEKLNITMIDDHKRSFSGGVEITAAGIQ